MTDFLQFVTALREQMAASLSRSDVLRPLAWAVGILLFSLVTLVLSGKAPSWLLVIMVILIILVVVLYIGAYVFFALKNPDALRSEKYSLSKMAIEHGVYGDSASEIIDPSIANPSYRALPSPVDKGSGEQS